MLKRKYILHIFKHSAKSNQFEIKKAEFDTQILETCGF